MTNPRSVPAAMSTRPGGLATWANSLNWVEDDDEQDSDTDSKLSGSAIVDSVMKRLRSKHAHAHYKGDHSYITSGEFSLDPIKDQSLSENDEEQQQRWGQPAPRMPQRSDLPSVARYGNRAPPHMSNGFSDHPASHSSPGLQRRAVPGQNASPRNVRRHYVQHEIPSSTYYPPVRTDHRKKEVLSPVPETTSSGARVVEVSAPPPVGVLGRNWNPGGGPMHRSSESLHSTPPLARREDRVLGEGGRSFYRMPPHARSHEALPRATMEGGRYGSEYVEGARSELAYPTASLHVRRNSSESGSGIAGPILSHINRGNPSPEDVGMVSHTRNRSWHNTELRGGGGGPPGFEGTHPGEQRTPPNRRPNYVQHHIPRDTSYHSNISHSETSASRYTDTSHEVLDSRGSSLAPRSDVSQTREPNLSDVVDFLSSEDPTLVSNAASYLQHLAYGDDSMKSKIRQFGAIPVLVSQLRNPDTKVQISVLGALRNLSYGRSNDDNKADIAGDHGLQEVLLALKMCRASEVRDLLTGLLWNISSCEELKLRIVKQCLQELVDGVLVPCSGWTMDGASSPVARPAFVQWKTELKNTTGTMRNVSSAGEPARVFMRASRGLVDSLLWIVKAAVQQKEGVDEKTVENAVCILRNLSYQLENEIDPQEGADDVLDRDWEKEQRREMEELERSSRKAPGCLAFLTGARGHEEPLSLSHIAARPQYHVNFADPDLAALPRRQKPVYGMALLWQPEVVYPYLALIEHYGSCADTLEAAAGAIQNLTACSWKWAVYSRNIIRTSNGLRVIADLLNNGHDAVVKAAATALRNLTADPRNKASLGVIVMPSIIPRLPFGSNHLGISEPTTIALLCTLMELCLYSPENAKLFREKEGIPYLTRLTRSRQHTAKVTIAANKVCSILYEYKDCKLVLKREGWDIAQYHRLVKENAGQFDFEQYSSMSRDYVGSRRKAKKSSKKDKEGKKKKKKSKREKSKTSAGVKLEEVPSELPVSPGLDSSTRTHSMASSATYAFSVDPNYSSIETSTSPQGQISAPTAIYQTISDLNEPQIQNSGKQQSETAAASTVSGPLSTTTSQDVDEQQSNEPDPHATYASVDIEKKRASRKLKERQQQLEQQQAAAAAESIDSWV